MIPQPGFKEVKPPASSDINPTRLRHFIKNIILAQKKLEKTKMARQDLSKHIKKLKRLPKGKKITKSFKGDIELLEKKIDFAISTEKKLFTQQQKDYFFSKFLEKRIAELEKKINEFLAYGKQRKKKIDQLEKKVKGKAITRTEHMQIIRHQIAELEKKYHQLKGKYPEETLKKIEEKINQLKEKITGP